MSQPLQLRDFPRELLLDLLVRSQAILPIGEESTFVEKEVTIVENGVTRPLILRFCGVCGVSRRTDEDNRGRVKQKCQHICAGCGKNGCLKRMIPVDGTNTDEDYYHKECLPTDCKQCPDCKQLYQTSRCLYCASLMND